MRLEEPETSINGSITDAGSQDDASPARELADYTSVIVFLTGIILARFGLWITDLTVTQVIQERVEEEQRGAFNGVQDSLNMTLDVVKSLLVIALPNTHQFGILILLSFGFVSTGYE